MKRLIFLLALCLCLNGLAAAEQAAPIGTPEGTQGEIETPPAAGGEADPNDGAGADPQAAENPGAGADAQAAENPEAGVDAQAAENPEAGADAQAAENPEAGTSPQAAENPEAGADAQAAENPGAGADAQAAENPGAGADPQAAENPEAGADAQAAKNPEAGPDAQAAENPEAGPDAQAAENTEAGADPQAAENPEAGADAQAAENPEAGADAQAAENPEAGTDAQAAENSEAGPDAQAAADPEAGPDAQAAENPEAGADAQTAENPETGADAQTAENPETGADAQAAANPEAGADAQAAENPEAKAEAGENAPVPEGETDPDVAEAVPAIPEDAEAWFERDGVKLGGRLEELVAQLNGGETVYIRAAEVLCLPQAPLKKLSGVRWLPDAEVFNDRNYEVRASREDPQAVEGAPLVALSDLAACGDGETGALYLWVADAAEPAPEPVPEAVPEPVPEPAPEPVITVAAENFVPATWSAARPTFTLGGIPEGATYTYAVIIYDERIIPLSGNTWTPEEEGVFTARFAMLDGIGDIVSASEKYTLWLDHTEPENVLVMPSSEVSYTMNIIAKDAMSGVAALSLDSGATWMPFANDQSYTYTGDHPEDFGPGSILVADVAGNVYVFQGEFRLEKIQPMPSYSGGGGGGGTSAKPKTHASGDGEDAAEYDALALEVPEEPMTRLTVGGESMDLTLTLESASHPDAPIGPSQPFTARLVRWGAPEGDGTPDTLLLDAQPGAELGDEYTYRWRFNGEVYRALANSDIRYVALKVGDHVAAFPTEGFTGGTKYTELKMLGVSTRRFDYSLDMKVNLDPGYVSTLSDCDFSTACDLSIRAEVENMAYELSSSTHSVMYFYDVYLGPEDMLSKPFGKYSA